MVRPLEKVAKSGKRYTRPPDTEAAIAEALTQDSVRLRARAAIPDRDSPAWLPSEVLVYLIRKAIRDDDAHGRDDLLGILLDRCKKTLTRTVREDHIHNAPDVREEVLSRFGALFAQHTSRLDYYEIRFESAFSTLRLDVQRTEGRRVRPLASLVEAFPEWGDDEPLGAELQRPATQEDAVYLRQALEALGDLRAEEREAFFLCRIMGFPVESDDPEKRTAATHFGVSPRTIRNRLARATAKLREWKEMG